MSYESAVEILPSSIFEKGLESNNRKLWKLYSEQLDDVENKILWWYDKDNLSGVALDKIGLLKGIPRNGLSDVDYRFELSLPRTLEIVTLDSVYQTISTFGINPRVKELHTPFLYDVDRLNGFMVLDGSWNLSPNLSPKVLNYLDGTWLLDGAEPIEPYGVRPLALLIQIETDESFEFQKMPAQVKKLLAGITVYYQFFFTFDLGLNPENFITTLNGSWLLDSSRTLSNDLQVVFYNNSIELYRLPIEVSGNLVIIKPLKRNLTITRFEIVSAGVILATKNFKFETSTYLQYQFTIT